MVKNVFHFSAAVPLIYVEVSIQIKTASESYSSLAADYMRLGLLVRQVIHSQRWQLTIHAIKTVITNHRKHTV